MRTPEQTWDALEIQLDRGVEQNWQHRQIEATLVLAEQVQRIADVLDGTNINMATPLTRIAQAADFLTVYGNPLATEERNR